MLKGISPLISPSLLKILAEMGHGDEIVIADANFPSETYGRRVVRADGIGGRELLDAILTLIPLDTYAEENFILMSTLFGEPTPEIWSDYFRIAKERDDNLRYESVRFTASPSQVTVLLLSSRDMPPMVIMSLSITLPPSFVYLRNRLFTLACSSPGLKGLVI